MQIFILLLGSAGVVGGVVFAIAYARRRSQASAIVKQSVQLTEAEFLALPGEVHRVLEQCCVPTLVKRGVVTVKVSPQTWTAILNSCKSEDEVPATREERTQQLDPCAVVELVRHLDAVARR